MVSGKSLAIALPAFHYVYVGLLSTTATDARDSNADLHARECSSRHGGRKRVARAKSPPRGLRTGSLF